MTFTGLVVVVTGGTGSLGSAFVRRLLSGAHGVPRKVIVFSRDEAKQHDMRVGYLCRTPDAATADILYDNFRRRLEFRVGDVRDYASVRSVLRDADVVLHAAALKQVPSCEYFPYEAVRTNVTGAENVVRAIREGGLHVRTVVGVSTDKACEPANVMGATKLLQERIFVGAGLSVRSTRFAVVRCGNVLSSRGSVVPLFLAQKAAGGPLTVTDPRMTRFLLPVERAVDAFVATVLRAGSGETWVPRMPSARITDVARAVIGAARVGTTTTGVRPGEKLYEVLVSEEEASRTHRRGNYYVVAPLPPDARRGGGRRGASMAGYRSDTAPLSFVAVRALLQAHGVLSRVQSA